MYSLKQIYWSILGNKAIVLIIYRPLKKAQIETSLVPERLQILQRLILDNIC